MTVSAYVERAAHNEEEIKAAFSGAKARYGSDLALVFTAMHLELKDQTIADIEFVIDAPALGDPRHSWTAYGVECTRDRHRYSGAGYEFNIEIVDLRRTKAGRTSWRVLIVTEWWQAAGEKGEIRNTKWLKVLNGKASDVKTWMRSCRSQKVDKGMGSQPFEF
jgi:hypothetical protein